MSSKAIIARLEQHLDHQGRLTLRPSDVPPVTDQAGSARQLLQQMMLRRKVNEERREQEFNQLRKLMAARRSPPVASGQALSSLCIGEAMRQVADNAKGMERTARPDGHLAWWSQASPIVNPAEAMAARHRTLAFASTMAASTRAFCHSYGTIV